MATGTESFNQANVQRDFTGIMEQADNVRRALLKGNSDLDSVIGNASMNDAYSGQAASSIKRQWEDLASTFENFMNNFKHWYDQSVETSKINAGLQAETSNVKGVNV